MLNRQDSDRIEDFDQDVDFDAHFAREYRLPQMPDDGSEGR